MLEQNSKSMENFILFLESLNMKETAASFKNEFMSKMNIIIFSRC
jgi:hypothetical protein